MFVTATSIIAVNGYGTALRSVIGVWYLNPEVAIN